MKKKKLGLIIPPAILLLAFCMEEIRPYEILHSTVMSSPNLTENHYGNTQLSSHRQGRPCQRSYRNPYDAEWRQT